MLRKKKEHLKRLMDSAGGAFNPTCRLTAKQNPKEITDIIKNADDLPAGPILQISE